MSITTEATILLAEEEDSTRVFLRDNLTADGYQVLVAPDRAKALALLSTAHPELIVVDVNGETLELLDTVRSAEGVAGRADPDTPVIVLSGDADRLQRIRMLERGGDDIVEKPFAYPELRARIAALLRRSQTTRRGRRILRAGPVVRLLHAGGAAAGSLVAALLALVVASAGVISVAAVLAVIAVGLALYARHWLGRADRSRIGANSEDDVRRQLAALERDGWRLRHSLPWRGRGDIDSVAIAPSEIAFAIETKTRRYDDRHLTMVQEQAAWLSKRRRRWCPRGAVPVLCVVRPRGVRRSEQGVLVASIDLLIPAVRLAAQAGLGRAA